MNMRGRGTAALLAAGGLVTGLLTGAPVAVAAGSPGTITTVAGGPGRGQATKVFQMPQALAAAPGGALYVGDGWVVRQFSNTKSYESVFAGNGGEGYSGNGKPATGAQLSAAGLAVDSSGNVLIADSNNSRIRVVAHSTGTFYGQAMTAGAIYTVAGNGKLGYSGDGGPATSAALTDPQSVAVDAAGNLVIADSDNWRVRVVAEKSGTFYGKAMTAGDIYAVAGNGTQGDTGDGGPAATAELQPWSATVDSGGNVVIADFSDSVVRVVAEKTGTFYGVAMTAGDIYRVAGTGTFGYSGDGGPATKAKLDFPSDVVADAAGNLVIADFSDGRVRVVAAETGTFYGQAMTAGDIYTVAGNGACCTVSSGGLATSSSVNQPQAVTFDANGNLVIADSGYDRVWVVAAKTGTFYGKAMTAAHIYIVAGNGSLGFSGSGGKATDAEITNCPRCAPTSNVAVDGGNYIVISAQQAWFIANKAGTYFGQAMTAGDIYGVSGTGFKGYAGDGGIATSARFANPGGGAVDAAGNLVIADTGNNRIRVVAAQTGTFYGQAMTADHIYTVAGDGKAGFAGDGGAATAAELNTPEEVAVDGAGNLVMADTRNERIRVVAATTGTFYGQAMTAGEIYTVAGNGTEGFSGDGGLATAAKLKVPEGVVVDRAGNLVIADTVNQRIRIVAATTGTFYGHAMTAGDIYTVAGTGKFGFSGDGGPGTAAEVSYPPGVTVDGAGNLLIADEGNNRIRVVAAASGTFYAQAMTAGDIYTVAGNGKAGFSGNGGPATGAELSAPEGVAVDPAGNVVIADSQNGQLRVVTG
jgi:trimeric autotransporter adhesin